MQNWPRNSKILCKQLWTKYWGHTKRNFVDSPIAYIWRLARCPRCGPCRPCWRTRTCRRRPGPGRCAAARGWSWWRSRRARGSGSAARPAHRTTLCRDINIGFWTRASHKGYVKLREVLQSQRSLLVLSHLRHYSPLALVRGLLRDYKTLRK